MLFRSIPAGVTIDRNRPGRWLVTLRLDGTAPLGSQLQIEIGSFETVPFAAAVPPSVSAATLEISQTLDLMTDRTRNRAAALADQANVAVADLRFQARGGPVTLRGVEVGILGSAVSSGTPRVSEIKIWEFLDQTGSFSPTTSRIIGRATITTETSREIAFGSPISLTTNEEVRLAVSFDLDGSAPIGQTVVGRILSLDTTPANISRPSVIAGTIVEIGGSGGGGSGGGGLGSGNSDDGDCGVSPHGNSGLPLPIAALLALLAWWIARSAPVVRHR